MREAGPRGVGLSVGLLWGVSVQLVAQGLSRLAASGVFASSGGERALSAVGALVAALVALVFGELVRRGVGWTRRLVVGLGLALAVFGFASLPGTVRDIHRGSFGRLCRLRS